MDDLEQKLDALLQDPHTMERVQTLLQSLGEESPAPDEPTNEPSPPPAAPAGADALLSGLLPLLSGAAEPNPDAALLTALKPYLHGERQKRLDEALKWMQIRKLLPLLRP